MATSRRLLPALRSLLHGQTDAPDTAGAAEALAAALEASAAVAPPLLPRCCVQADPGAAQLAAELLAAAPEHGDWLQHLGPQGVAALSRLLAAAAAASADTASLPAAAHALLALCSRSLQHTSWRAPSSSQLLRELAPDTAAAMPAAAPCCAAVAAVLADLTQLVLSSPDGLAAHADVVRGVHGLVRQLLAASPQRTAPKLDWHGRPTGYCLVLAAADPCRPPPAAGARAAAAAAPPRQSSALAAWVRAWELGAPSTLLESALLVLLAVCQAGERAQRGEAQQGRTAAQQLYRADVSAMLEQLRGFQTPAVVSVAQRIYRCLCLQLPQLREEVLDDAAMPVLCELIRQPATASAARGGAVNSEAVSGGGLLPALAPVHSFLQQPAVPLRLQLDAMRRLAGALSSVSGAAFLAFVGGSTGGGDSGASSRSGSGSGSGLAAVAAHVSAGLEAQADSASAAALTPLQRQLVDAARQAFTSALERAREMQRLAPSQLPRGGWWSQQDVGGVRQLEAWAANPGAPAAPAAAATAAGPGLGARDGLPAHAAAPPAVAGRPAPPTGGQQAAPASGGAHHTKRRAGSAAPAAAAAGRNAAAAAQAEEEQDPAAGWDEDGLRVAWTSGPSAAAVAARAVWKQLTLGECLQWSQSASDLELRLLLPADTRRQDLAVRVAPERLTVRLGWRGRVLDGPLAKRVKANEAVWSLDAAEVDLGRLTAGRRGAPGSPGGPLAGAAQLAELLLIVPKEEGGRFWRALFEGGEEKSHLQVLQEALASEDDAPSVDQLGPEAALLLAELRERQASLAAGELDLAAGFDDFRLVLGDAML